MSAWPLRILFAALPTLAIASCEEGSHPSNPDEHVFILEPDTDPDLDEARIAPDRLPELTYVYRSAGEDFQIRFPGKPQVNHSMIPSARGQIELITISYDYSITKAYWASYSDYPTEMIRIRPAEEILSEARKSVVAGLGPSTQFEEISDSLRQGYPSLRFRARDAHFHAIYELILVENRLYQLGVLRDGKYPQDQDIRNFFGGFELVGRE